MGRLLVFLAVLCAASLLWVRQMVTNPLSPTVEGRELTVRSEQIQARFARGPAFSGSYMIFGGLNDESRLGFSNAQLAFIDLAEARWLMQEYPDFHRCASPGADHAKRMVQDYSMIAADGHARRAIHAALDEHEASVAAGGDRVCIRLGGEELDLSNLDLLDGDHELPEKYTRIAQRNRYRFVQSAERIDCRSTR